MHVLPTVTSDSVARSTKLSTMFPITANGHSVYAFASDCGVRLCRGIPPIWGKCRVSESPASTLSSTLILGGRAFSLCMCFQRWHRIVSEIVRGYPHTRGGYLRRSFASRTIILPTTMQQELKATKDIIVIGAGVIGLSTAIKIQEKGGYRVTIVAETFPTDPKTIRYTSHWAGAHHVSGAYGSKRQREMDSETFDIMWKDSENGGPVEGCFLRHKNTQYRSDGVDPSEWLDHMPGFRPVSNDELVPGATHGWTFTTLTLYPPVYLNWLLGRFLGNGGKIVRAQLQHINQAIHGGISGLPQEPDAVVACVGLGARFLGGIEDKEVYPVRGQTVVLKAPWVRYGRTLTYADGSHFYLMPRATGDVLVGGIRVADDWFPVPREQDRDYLLAGGLAMCPELAPPDIRAERMPTVDDLRPLIVDEGCGLRPGRKSGIRLATEWPEGSKIPVVYNYGHSGMGFQSSWGSASVALNFLEEALAGEKPGKAKEYEIWPADYTGRRDHVC